MSACNGGFVAGEGAEDGTERGTGVWTEVGVVGTVITTGGMGMGSGGDGP